MITLCVMFNHAYPQNIPLLRKLLRPRFSDVVFIQPVVRSQDPDVFTSYRGSYNFQGLISDNLDKLISRGSSHYIFVHDDVFVNPLLNEDNIVERLGVGTNGAFITGVGPMGGRINGPAYRGWNWIVGVLWKLAYPTNTISGSGVQSLSRDFADLAGQTQQIADRYGFEFPPFSYDPSSPPPFTDPFGSQAMSDELVGVIFRGLFGEGDPPSLTPPIALCLGFSDFFVVDGAIMERVGHLFGVFAAANIFAEVAIPTALIHVADRLVQAHDVGVRTNWSYEPSLSVETLIEEFRTGLLLAHPVKPSAEGDKLTEITKALTSA